MMHERGGDFGGILTVRSILGPAVGGLVGIVAGVTGTGAVVVLDMTASMLKGTLIVAVKWSCNALLVRAESEMRVRWRFQ